MEFLEASYTLSPKRKFTLCFQLQQGACLRKPIVYLGHCDGKFTIPNSAVRCTSLPLVSNLGNLFEFNVWTDEENLNSLKFKKKEGKKQQP